MQVFRDPDALPQWPNPVLTIGTFDGVHKGHQALIAKVRAMADACQGTAVLVTFHPHPRSVIQPDAHVPMLQSLEEKLEALAGEGLDAVVVVPFTRAFSNQSGEAYVRDFLLGKLRPHTAVIGYDHRFGHDRSGDIGLLRRIIQERTEQGKAPVHIVEIDKQEVDAMAVSSTRIRQALGEGRVADAADLLGRPYALRGIVVRGDQIGRTLGYPTANLHVSDSSKLIPADGVYAVAVERPASGKARDAGTVLHGAMASIGMRPTFAGQDRRIEAHLFGFEGDLYGAPVEIRFLAWLRDEAQFDGQEALVKAMDRDREASRRLLAERMPEARLD
jgi:riboflavin kinase/FMN adenylyltransferase